MADKSTDLLTSLDVGSSKIVCAVASPISQDCFRLEALGVAKSRGIGEGIVTDINAAVEAIREAVEAAEKDTGTTIKRVSAGISGAHVCSVNRIQQAVIGHGEIQQSDVENLKASAQSGPLQPSMNFLDVIPQEYAVDDIWGIKNPVSMTGSRLEGKMHVLAARSGPCQNLTKALRRTGLDLINEQLTFNPLSSAAAVLTPEEIKLGVALIDIGAHLTEVAVYFDDAVRHSFVIPMGGQAITDEISVKTQLSTEAAESVKRKMGQAKFDRSRDKDDYCQLPAYADYSRQIGSRMLARQALSDMIDLKLEEILRAAYEKLQIEGMTQHLAHGVVLTGGGAKLRGIDRMAKEVFSMHMAGRDMNVRIGAPLFMERTREFIAPEAYATLTADTMLAGFSLPEYATVMGSLFNQNRSLYIDGSSRKIAPSWWRKASSTLRTWVLGNF